MIEAQPKPTFDTPPAAIHQWQWEESINALRRRVPESAIRRHWTTTGVTAIDACARAHIAEWQRLDVAEVRPQATAIVDALIHRRLFRQHWDLYVVEAHHNKDISVRTLRDQRGYRLRWLEGRTPPVVGATVALRLIHLDPPGLWASTLPIEFGNQPGRGQLVMALLRSFGAHRISSWSEFMGGPGARIVLEYGLSHLEHRAARQERDDPESLLNSLERAFTCLESALDDDRFTVPRKIELESGRIAWIEDITDGPHLILFDGPEELDRYQRAVGSTNDSDPVEHHPGWCRIHRACPGELSPAEYAMAALAGLRPARDGMVKMRRRDRHGHFVDPRPCDVRAVQRACRRMAGLPQQRAA